MTNSGFNRQPKFNRSRNASRNAVFGFINRFFSLLVPFIVRTIVIYRFGAEYLGLNSLFSSVLQVLSLADFGFGTAIVYSLYRPVAEGDTETVCAYLGTYKKIYRIIGWTILGCGILVMPFLPHLIRDVGVPGNLNLYIWYGIFLLNASVSYLLYGYKTAIPTALQRNDILSRIDIAVMLGKAVVQVVFLLLSNNFYFYLLTSLFFTIARNLLVCWAVNLRFPQYKCSGSISKEQVTALKPRVYGILIAKLRWISRNGIDSICITSFLGLTMTAIYSNYMCIHNAVISLSVVLCTAMMPSVGNSIATETAAKNYKDMRRFNFMYMLIGGWASLCLLCMYQPFVRFWVGEQLMLGFPEVVALTVYYYVSKMGDIRWVYFEGAGLWWTARYYAVAETLANICLNVLLAKYFGVLGIILATLISLFFIDFIFGARILFQHYYCNGKLREFFTDHMRYFLITVLLAVPCIYVCDWLNVIMADTGTIVFTKRILYGILGLFVRLLICTIISAFGYYLVYHHTAQFKEAKAWVLERYRSI